MSTPDPVPHRTGLRHVDLFVAGCALLVSVVSLFIAYQANRTQERMLAAGVWPYVSWGTSNLDQNQQDEISFNLYNLGVGPARLQSLQVFYKGQPVAGADALVLACCQAQAAGLKNWELRTSGISKMVLPGHDSIKFLSLPRHDGNAALWQVLNLERRNVTMNACYCSVLDQCWTVTGEGTPQSVRRCDAPEPQYR